MFRITSGKGFQITFENGWTISVQFGGGNYCANYHDRIGGESYVESGERGCQDAEIAIFNEANDWVDFGSDTVKGRVKAEEVAEWIQKTATGDVGLLKRMPTSEELMAKFTKLQDDLRMD